jgi:hypothetical protein
MGLDAKAKLTASTDPMLRLVTLAVMVGVEPLLSAIVTVATVAMRIHLPITTI